MDGLVGRHPAVPHPGVRPDPSRSPVVQPCPTPPSTSSTPRPADALRRAKEAAGGKDVRLGGGVATVREFLDADLVDTMHVAVAPVELGRGERLWTSHSRAPRPLQSRHRAEPQRSDAPPLLVSMTAVAAGGQPRELTFGRIACTIPVADVARAVSFYVDVLDEVTVQERRPGRLRDPPARRCRASPVARQGPSRWRHERGAPHGVGCDLPP